jgi:hypothetical protein
MAAGANIQVDVRFWNAERREKRGRHCLVVVLAGVDNDLLDTGGNTGAVHGGKLRKIWPRADDVE